MQTKRNMQTLVVHAGERRPGPEGSVVFPIYQGTVFELSPGSGYHDIQYGRLSSTPSQTYLHDKLRALEGAEAALATSSGMAAISTTLLTFLKNGDHFLIANSLYGGTHDFVTKHAAELGWTYTSVDPHAPETWAAAVTPKTRLFYVEAIVNPTMRVPKHREVAAFSKKAGILSIVDSTFANPINFQPLALGFDLVVHSATKYLNGHSDIVAGALMGSQENVTAIRKSLNLYGGSLDPHAGFLLARGIKTMAIRVKAHNENGMKLAEFLGGHRAVESVSYPGLASHPDHAHAAQLFSGFGGMIALRVRGGTAAAEKMLAALELPAVAPSLGGVETLITRPATTSHAGMAPDDRRRLGIADDLIRISCGIEAADDLIADFGRALDAL
ncbi:MAG TPA: PLP-dependent transferase [Polyangiaceae bacterium]|jgi:cystathionine gamma-synthase/cystathionine gamma-lyase/cystathionine beta-lyase